jgi:hypothetical protein
MRWIKFSRAPRLFIYVIIIVFVCGFIPLLFIHHSTPETVSSLEISNLIKKLENEHNKILASIQTLEKIAEDALKQSDKAHLNRSFHLNSDPRLDSFPVESYKVEIIKGLEKSKSVQPDNVTGVVFPEVITYNTPNSMSSSSVLVVGGTGSFIYFTIVGACSLFVSTTHFNPVPQSLRLPLKVTLAMSPI